MKRAEAQRLIGQQVIAWTALNGEYVGTLESVHGSPFRATVRITGIVKPAMHLHNAVVCRRGFRAGETIEVGHSSMRPCAPGLQATASYLVALEAELAFVRSAKARQLATREAWLWPALEDALLQVHAAERRRLAGEPWRLVVEAAATSPMSEGRGPRESP